MRAGRLSTALAAVLIAAAACGDRGTPAAPGAAGPQPAAPGADLAGRTFVSTDVTENGRPRPLAERTRVRLQFTGDGRLLADAGCNTMQGPVRLGDGRVEVPDLSSTDLGCDPPRHDQDTWLANFLRGTPSWRMAGSDLVVTSPTTELVLRDREVAEPDLPLVGTRWTVDTLVDGEVASSVPASGAAALVFEADRVLVSAGCNSGSGGYRLSGSTIRFEAIATTRKACEPELMALESAVLAVLAGEVAYTVDADRLTVEHPSGRALQLRGQRG